MAAIQSAQHAAEVPLPWVKVDDGLPDHPKFLDLSHIAARLWLHASCWSARKLTDGFVPVTALPTLLPKDEAFARESAAGELVLAGILHVAANGWVIHDFLDYNPSRKKTLKKRKKNADRLRRWRKDAGRKRNASETVLHDASKRVSNAVSNAAPDPDPHPLTSTGTYGAADASRFPQEGVKNQDRQAASPWKRAIAIAHVVMEAWPNNPENWSPETKTRLQEQHLDPSTRSPRGGPIFIDAIEFATTQRRERGARVARRQRAS